MSSTGWRKSTSIIHKLLEEPHRFGLQQAVRLLERSAVYEKNLGHSNIMTNPISRFTPPENEFVRFKGNTSLAFPSSEVTDVKKVKRDNTSSQWQLLTDTIGLTGAMGVLPYHYTELIQGRAKQKDETFKHFLDLFNHRTISLFVKASNKYRLPVQYEHNHLHDDKHKTDTHTTALLSLIGMGTPGLANRLYTKDDSLVYYSGLLSQKLRTSTGLRQILRSHFNIPVKVDEFIGQWQELINDVRSKLPDINNPKGCNACLGRSAMLGSKGWFAQGKIRIVLGPLNKKQVRSFAPGTQTLKALHEITRLYVGIENDYELIIKIKKYDMPTELSLKKENPPIIGWNSRLPSGESSIKTFDQTVDISVSSEHLN